MSQISQGGSAVPAGQRSGRDQPPVVEDIRLEAMRACRRWVEEGCGGRHENGPLLAGRPISVYCKFCPKKKGPGMSRPELTL